MNIPWSAVFLDTHHLEQNRRENFSPPPPLSPNQNKFYSILPKTVCYVVNILRTITYHLGLRDYERFRSLTVQSIALYVTC